MCAIGMECPWRWFVYFGSYLLVITQGQEWGQENLCRVTNIVEAGWIPISVKERWLKGWVPKKLS